MLDGGILRDSWPLFLLRVRAGPKSTKCGGEEDGEVGGSTEILP